MHLRGGQQARAAEVVAGRRGPGATVVAAVVVGAIARLALAAWAPITVDEAYYADWARHFSAGYLDHPPARDGGREVRRYRLFRWEPARAR